MPNPLYPSVLPVLRNLPAEHPRQPFLPGLKRRPMSLWPFLFILAFFVMAVPVITWRESLQSRALPQRSIADGRVTQVERIGPAVPLNSQQSFIKYRFMAGNDLVNGSEIADSSALVPDIGDRVQVSYLPETPSDNFRVLAEAQKSKTTALETYAFAIAISLFLLVWLSFMFLLFSPVTPRDWLEWRRARKLYRNGEIAAGRVQFVRNSSTLRSPNRHNNYEIVATYKVEGVRHLAVTRCNNEWLVNQLPPDTEVVVAHDPLKPERAVILEPFAF